QMLAVSRALMLRPRLLLLDEPSFGLAPLVVQHLFEIFRVINAADRIGMLLVEQNAAMALKLADHAYLLETGRVVMSGPAEAIRSDESVRRSYLGY
ncbi:MAG: ABC transporter ATP-binding protein, partial [Caldimonas sp.]